MEVIQGKPKDKKIVIAQEIAFAKVLAGNNKTLRDRAVKKLKKWLTVRGNGKWRFTEDEFMRIWTGLFYCMWMSDKFLIQEELAESISSLIHCFKKNTDSALLFIKCFNKRILMDWEGLDQYRIDKFCMLVRRFLRQTFVYCKEKDWEQLLLHKLMGIFYNIILHHENSLGFVMHFISIYAEELAKVSKGKIETKTVLQLIEPFVKLLGRSKDVRILKELEDFFNYLMRQTNTGIEFEEKFNAWKEQGFPGEGPHCMINITLEDENQKSIGNGDDVFSEEDEREEELNQPRLNQPLDPRAGSIHVILPQIPLDLDGIISLFKKHQNSKHANVKGRRILKSLTQKFEALKRGKFPAKIKKDPILTEAKKKKRQTIKKAIELLNFTEKIDQEPIKTKEFQKISRKLDQQIQSFDSNEELNEKVNVKIMEKVEELNQKVKNNNNNNNNIVSKNQKEKLNSNLTKFKKTSKKQKISNEIVEEIKENGNLKENYKKQKKKKKGKNRKLKKNNEERIIKNEIELKSETYEIATKKPDHVTQELQKVREKVTFFNKPERKRKILSNWQVHELDSSSPDYYKIQTPKIIKLERKISTNSCEENNLEKLEEDSEKNEEMPTRNSFPVFWEKARKKITKKNSTKNKIFVNPFANQNLLSVSGESKSQSRRISFALDKNMAQENEEYLEEVKNSPRVPFDGTKKPVQSALKSGLAPSPVNPFYRFKKIKF